MTGVLAFLAFAMAFGAIWFTSEALRRVDTRNTAMLKPHLGKIHVLVDENKETIKSLKKRLDQMEKQVRILKLSAELPPEIEREIDSPQSGLTDLQRYTPTIRLNG